MKNIHVLPTDKPSRLRYNLSNVLVLTKEPYRDYSKQVNQNIYITNDEEIKEGDWVITPTNDIIQWAKVFQPIGKKIILTTDQYLIRNSVQAIDDEFLEWFVKNPSCEEVEVKLENYYASGALQPNLWLYKIIILKEEPKQFSMDANLYENHGIVLPELPKQETLEEREPYWDLVDAKAEQNNTIDLDAYAKGVQDGANWQQERSYSEEEVLRIITSCKEYLSFGDEFNEKEWFEQFKKK